jgi:hypothetical protein
MGHPRYGRVYIYGPLANFINFRNRKQGLINKFMLYISLFLRTQEAA